MLRIFVESKNVRWLAQLGIILGRAASLSSLPFVSLNSCSCAYHKVGSSLDTLNHCCGYTGLAPFLAGKCTVPAVLRWCVVRNIELDSLRLLSLLADA